MSAPLDKNAAVLYGSFIDTAYEMYDKPQGDPLTPQQPADFPAGYEMTAWIQMFDFAFGGETVKKFYGFIVRSIANPYSHVLAIRGTEGAIEWYDDAVCVPRKFTPVPQAGYVSSGFDQIYSTLEVVRCPRPVAPGTVTALAAAAPQSMSGSGSFADQIEDLLTSLPVAQEHAMAVGPEPKHTFFVAGHSLGGALCTLYTMEHAIKTEADPSRKVVIATVCTFASPRVGMEVFAQAFNALTINSWRIANDQDIVPKIPPAIPILLPYQHVNTLYAFSSAGMVNFNPSCWHSMKTYLHWLDSNQKLDPDCVPG
jgi:hypothetical protein